MVVTLHFLIQRLATDEPEGVQFRQTPLLQPKNQESQTSVNFRRTRRQITITKSIITNIYIFGRGIKNQYLILITNSINLTFMVISNYLLVTHSDVLVDRVVRFLEVPLNLGVPP